MTLNNDVTRFHDTCESVSSFNNVSETVFSFNVILELVSSFQENQERSKSIQNKQNDKNFIYHVNKLIKEKRLCISSICVLNILIIVHDQDHSEFDVCFEIIIRF
jgi:hypothetical protein